MILLTKYVWMVIVTQKLNLTNRRYLALTSCSLKPLFGEPKFQTNIPNKSYPQLLRAKKYFTKEMNIIDISYHKKLEFIL